MKTNKSNNYKSKLELLQKKLAESFDAFFFKSIITLTILYVEDCQTTTR